MLADHGAQQKLVLDTFGEASEALGYDLWALTQKGPEEQLNQTDKTQPAILTASIALWRLWQAEGGAKPAFVAGHSLGEYSALVAAGSLPFADAVKLVELRGQLMQQAVPAGQGGMAAILGLEDADVLAVCAEAAQDRPRILVRAHETGREPVAARHRNHIDVRTVLAARVRAMGENPDHVHVVGSPGLDWLKREPVMDREALEAIWSRLIFSGKGQAPRELGGAADIKAALAANPNALGYLDKADRELRMKQAAASSRKGVVGSTGRKMPMTPSAMLSQPTASSA